MGVGEGGGGGEGSGGGEGGGGGEGSGGGERKLFGSCFGLTLNTPTMEKEKPFQCIKRNERKMTAVITLS